jgi:hypothetical protein
MSTLPGRLVGTSSAGMAGGLDGLELLYPAYPGGGVYPVDIEACVSSAGCSTTSSKVGFIRALVDILRTRKLAYAVAGLTSAPKRRFAVWSSVGRGKDYRCFWGVICLLWIFLALDCEKGGKTYPRLKILTNLIEGGDASPGLVLLWRGWISGVGDATQCSDQSSLDHGGREGSMRDQPRC